MQILNVFFSSIAILLSLQGVVSAETFRVADDEWLWFSSNLEKTDRIIDPKSNNTIEHQDSKLGNFTYDKYFERNGEPPAHNFLQLLNKDVQSARIEGRDIVFLKTGFRLPLKTDLAPSGTDQALPFLMEAADTKMVLAVYPYYFFGCKDNDHSVELYSEDGSLIHQFDSLPTHAVKNNPELLISPERSGCCDSLKWNIRFYDLKKGKVSKYGCPEGACGDLLFRRLARDGPFLIGLELIGSLSGVGAFLQANIFIVNDVGISLASGKIIHTLRSSSINKRNIQAISPFSISKLSSLKPVKGSGSNMWRIQFEDEVTKIPLVINGNFKNTTPAVVFLIPKEADQKRIIKFDNQDIAAMPTIGICEPGSYTLSGEMLNLAKRINVQPDMINRIIY